MKKFKSMISLMMVVLMMVALTGCGGNNGTEPEVSSGNGDGGEVAEVEVQTLTLAMDSPEDTVTYLFAEKFAQLLEEKTAGELSVQLYPNGQLGGDLEIAESVQQGNVDFVIQTTAPQVNFVPELAIFDMAKVFPDEATARNVFAGPFFDTIAAQYEKAGIRLLAYADQGFRQMTTNQKIETIEDFSGQKIRTMENPNHIAYWTALGANPTPMAWGEVYIGLQQSSIDAQENPYEVIVANRIYEQQDYVINTNHILHVLTLITNPAKFDSMSAEQQQAIEEAANEAKEWANEQADARVADRVSIMEENGVEIVDLSDELHAEMQERAATVYDSIRENVGAELVDGLLEAVENAE